MVHKPYVGAVIVAAGSGTRMGGIEKPLITLGGITVIERVVAAFSSCPSVDELVVVCKDSSPYEKLIKTKKPIAYTVGGRTRSDSVSNGADVLKHADIICVHDCARPFVTPDEIEKLIAEAIKTGAASACSKVTDTIKYISEEEKCAYTPKRENLIAVRTPQVFRRDIYLAARAKALKDNVTSTDETSIIEHAGFEVSYVETSDLNIKLTDANDVRIAKAICFLEEKSGI